MRTIGWLGLVVLVVGCSSKSPEAPSPVGVSGPAGVGESEGALSKKPAVPASGTVDLQDMAGTLDVTGRYENTVQLRAHEALVSEEGVAAVRVNAKFRWSGTFVEGYTPFDVLDVGEPGGTVNLNSGWNGIGCSNTTLEWDKRTITKIGSAMSYDGCSVEFIGTVTLPKWTGQTTATASGEAQMGDPQSNIRSALYLSDPKFTINLRAIGTVTVTLAWVPIPVTGLPDGYWRLTRVTYRFGHGQ